MSGNKLTEAGGAERKAPRWAVSLLVSVLIPASSALAAFEDLGSGARPVAMGSAFTAVADDVHAVYSNPAGLAQVRRPEVSASYGKLYLGLKDNSNLGTSFAAAAIPLKAGKLGTAALGWTSLSLDGAYREDQIALSYGKELLTDGLFLGATGKVLRRTFGSDIYTQADPLFQQKGANTSNFSFDMGALYRPSANWSFAMALKDANQPDVALESGDKVPLEFRGGVAYHQRQLLFDAELSKKDKDFNFSSGIEKLFAGSFALRAGFTAGSRSRRELATGFGYRGGTFQLDYAFVFPMAGVEAVAGSHRFGLTVRFGKAPARASWDFEEDSEAVQRVLEEKSAQIATMEKELDSLREVNKSSNLESAWVRQQIQKLQGQISTQQSQELDSMRARLLQSKLEEDKMKRRILELENRLKDLSVQPRKGARPVPEIKEPAQAAPEASVPRTYPVQDGDTLQSIARKFYNDETRWVDIYELNSDRIERGGTVRSGQVLLMPQK